MMPVALPTGVPDFTISCRATRSGERWRNSAPDLPVSGRSGSYQHVHDLPVRVRQHGDGLGSAYVPRTCAGLISHSCQVRRSRSFRRLPFCLLGGSDSESLSGQNRDKGVIPVSDYALACLFSLAALRGTCLERRQVCMMPALTSSGEAERGRFNGEC